MKSLNISKVLSYLFIMVGVVGMAVSPVETVRAVTGLQIDGPAQAYSCVGSEANRWKTNNENYATLPDGYNLEDVVVKSGSNCIPVHPANGALGCYEVEIDGNTVTVTQLVDSNDCQAISHLEGLYSIPEETSTPTPVPDDRPSMSSESACGSVTVTFNNPTNYFFSGDYRVDSEAGTDDQYTNMVIQNGPHAGETFGQRFNIVDLPSGSVENKAINFAEDSGTHLVEYRIFRGAENDWYLDWESVEVESDCEENSTPTPTPTSTPNVVSSLATVDPSCESDTVTAIHKVAENNQPVQGVRVRFTYNGEEQTIETDADGKATARFTYTGDGYVDSYPDGFAHAANYITKETDCDGTPAVGGLVLGASTEGPESYAETGVAEDVIMSLVGLMGAGLFTSGSIAHVKAKK